jgi:hypothetical protein
MKYSKSFIAIISLIIVSGIAIRLLPNILNYAWGNDYGIYYYLSEAFISGKSLAYPPNSPWGTDGYQYFPVTYLIVDAVHFLFHIKTSIALDYSIPILGGLTPFLIYLISREVGFDRMTSALAGFLLVVSPIQLYQTSQPNYLTTGHFFLLLSVYFFLAYHKKKIMAIPMAASIVLLVLSHQLSTYFFLISIIGMVFAVDALSSKWKHYLIWDILVIELTGTLMIGYLLLRVPNMVHFFSSAVHGLGYVGVIVLFYAFALAMYFILRRWNSDRFLTAFKNVLGKMKMSIDPRRDVYLAVVAGVVIALLLSVMIAIGYLPSFITYSAVVISIPFIIFLAISVIGIKYLALEGNSSEVFGWSMAIILSLLYSLASKNTVLLPARHIEYLSEPFSVIAGYVLARWYLHFRDSRKDSTTRIHPVITESVMSPVPINSPSGVTMVMMPRERVSRRISYDITQTRKPVENIVVIAAVSLVLLMGVASYPMVNDFVPSHNEALTFQDHAVISYLNVTGNRSLSVATDHQIGILLYSYGFNSPFDYLSTFWNSTEWNTSSVIYQLTGENGTYPPIGYVILDTYMLQYGVWGYNSSLNPNEASVMLNNSSFNKFFDEPFGLLYKNESFTHNSTTFLFDVNWTYLGEKGYNLSYYMGLYEQRENSPAAIQLSPISQVSGQMIEYYRALSPPLPCFPSLQRQLPYLLSPVPPPQESPQLRNSLQ